MVSFLQPSHQALAVEVEHRFDVEVVLHGPHLEDYRFNCVLRTAYTTQYEIRNTSTMHIAPQDKRGIGGRAQHPRQTRDRLFTRAHV
jgi:hypothetical protein